MLENVTLLSALQDVLQGKDGAARAIVIAFHCDDPS